MDVDGSRHDTAGVLTSATAVNAAETRTPTRANGTNVDGTSASANLPPVPSSVPRARAGSSEGVRIGLPHSDCHARRVPAFTSLSAALPVSYYFQADGTTPSATEDADDGLRILALGAIDARPAYHAYKFIWPVGFVSQRKYWSVSRPGERVWYRCEIVDGGTTGPEFIVREEDGRSPEWRGKTATAVWTDVDTAVNARSPQPKSKQTGPERLGFGYRPVMEAIEGMPGADSCLKYYFLEQREAGAVFPGDAPKPQAAPAPQPALPATQQDAPTTKTPNPPPEPTARTSSRRPKVPKIYSMMEEDSEPEELKQPKASRTEEKHKNLAPVPEPVHVHVYPVPEYNIDKLMSNTSSPEFKNVAAAVSLEFLLWLGRTRVPDASCIVPKRVQEERSQILQELRNKAPGSESRPSNARQAWYADIPQTVLEDLMEVWEFLRANGIPLGLDTVFEARGNDMSPLSLQEFARLVCAPATVEEHTTANTIMAALTRAAFSALPSVVDTDEEDVNVSFLSSLREYASSFVDGDTWQEFLRRVFAARAQHLTGVALWDKLGTGIEEDLAENPKDDSNVFGGLGAEFASLAWIHFHRGATVLNWISADLLNDETNALADYTEAMLRPFDAYETARNMHNKVARALNVRTFPPVHHALENGTPYSAETLARAPLLQPHQIGLGVWKAPEASLHEEPPKPELNCHWGDALFSLFGLSTRDASASHVYLYGTICHVIRAIEADASLELEDEDDMASESEDSVNKQTNEANPAKRSRAAQLLHDLRGMVGQLIKAQEDEAAHHSGRKRASLTLRRASDLERQRRRQEKQDRDPMVLAAGKLREAALFSFRRYLLNGLPEIPGFGALLCSAGWGGVDGEWMKHPQQNDDAAVQQLRVCEGIRRAIAAMPEAEPYLLPLDADSAGVPEYFDLIKTPMDLRTVGQRLIGCALLSSFEPSFVDGAVSWTVTYDHLKNYNPSVFAQDMRQVFRNAMDFNDRDSAYYTAAKHLADAFDALWNKHFDAEGKLRSDAPFDFNAATSALASVDARLSDTAVGDDAAKMYLRWPSKRSYGRNKYLRQLAAVVIPKVSLVENGEIELWQDESKTDAVSGSKRKRGEDADALDGDGKRIRTDDSRRAESDAGPVTYVSCSICGTSYHMDSVHPVLDSIPEGGWTCAICVSCGIGGDRHGEDDARRSGRGRGRGRGRGKGRARLFADRHAFDMEDPKPGQAARTYLRAATFGPGAALVDIVAAATSETDDSMKENNSTDTDDVVDITENGSPRNAKALSVGAKAPVQRPAGGQLAALSASSSVSAGAHVTGESVSTVSLRSVEAVYRITDSSIEASKKSASVASTSCTWPATSAPDASAQTVKHDAAASSASFAAVHPAVYGCAAKGGSTLSGSISKPVWHDVLYNAAYVHPSCYGTADILPIVGPHRILTAMDYDAPAGVGPSKVEDTTLLRIAPPMARPLWRLVAAFGKSEWAEMDGVTRVRALKEVVTILASAPRLARHLESLAELSGNLLARIRSLQDQRPPERRASRLARLGCDMRLVHVARLEEERRIRSDVLSLTWLTVRPPKPIIALAKWGMYLPPWSAVTNCIAEMAAEIRKTASGKKADPQLLSFFVALTTGNATSAATNGTSDANTFARSNLILNGDALGAESAAASVKASLASSAITPASWDSIADPAAFVQTYVEAEGPLQDPGPGPWPTLSSVCARALAALAVYLPRPSAAAQPAKLSKGDSSSKPSYAPTAFRGVSMHETRAGIEFTTRLQLSSGTRSVGQFPDDVSAARAYDIVTVGMRGIAASKMLNFPGDAEMYWAVAKEFMRTQGLEDREGGDPDAGGRKSFALVRAAENNPAVDETPTYTDKVFARLREAIDGADNANRELFDEPAETAAELPRGRNAFVADVRIPADALQKAVHTGVARPALPDVVPDVKPAPASLQDVLINNPFPRIAKDVSLLATSEAASGLHDDRYTFPYAVETAQDELDKQQHSTLAYPAPFSLEEAKWLARLVILHSPKDGKLTADTWNRILLSGPFNPARTALDLLLAYESMRENARIWDAAVTAAVEELRFEDPLMDAHFIPFVKWEDSALLSEDSRQMMLSRAFLDWQEQISQAERLAWAVPGRVTPIGVDRDGLSVYIFDHSPSELWVRGRSLYSNAIKGAASSSRYPDQLRHTWMVIDDFDSLDRYMRTLNRIAVNEGELFDFFARHSTLLKKTLGRASSRAHFGNAPAKLDVSSACATCLQPKDVPFQFDSHHDASTHLYVSTTPISQALTPASALQSVTQGVVRQSLLHFKQCMIALQESIDWSRLKYSFIWPVSARAEWNNRVLHAAAVDQLVHALDVLENALRADDHAASVAGGPSAPLSAFSQQSGNNAADGGELALPWRWLSYKGGLGSLPRGTLPTQAFLAMKIRQLAVKLQPHLLWTPTL